MLTFQKDFISGSSRQWEHCSLNTQLYAQTVSTDGHVHADVMFADSCPDPLDLIAFLHAHHGADAQTEPDKWLLRVFISTDETITGRHVAFENIGHCCIWCPYRPETFTLIMCDSRLDGHTSRHIVEEAVSYLCGAWCRIKPVRDLLMCTIPDRWDDAWSAYVDIMFETVFASHRSYCRNLWETSRKWGANPPQDLDIWRTLRLAFPTARRIVHHDERLHSVFMLDRFAVAFMKPGSHLRVRIAAKCLQEAVAQKTNIAIIVSLFGVRRSDECKDLGCSVYCSEQRVVHLKALSLPHAITAMETAFAETSGFASECVTGKAAEHLIKAWQGKVSLAVNHATCLDKYVCSPDEQLVRKIRVIRQMRALAVIARGVRDNLHNIKARLWHPKGRLHQAQMARALSGQQSLMPF